MFHIAICDDDPYTCSQIERIILNYGMRKTNCVEVDVHYSGEKLIRYLKNGTYYDMIFLDIGLKKLNGIDVGRRIRNVLNNEAVQIVYTSSNEGYAMDLFEVRPMHFLVKPVEEEKILSVLEKGMKLANKLCQTFEYKLGHDIKKIPAKSILYFESLDRRVKMITMEGEEVFYGAMADIIPRAEKYGFFSCHKSYLVNYQHVLKFEYDKLHMKNGMTLPISQPKRKCVRALQMKLEFDCE